MADENVSLMRRYPTRAAQLLWHQLRKKRVCERRFRLESQGFHVGRFCNDDVLRNLEGVVRAIELAMSRPAPEDPSP